MCCRYYFDEESAMEIRRIVTDADRSVRWDQFGDIHPADSAIIISGRDSDLYAKQMRWGFPGYQSKQMMINARAETAMQKPSFSESVLKRRCIIVAKHFYEWNRDKVKVTFTWPESGFIYMAGFYKEFDGENRFVVLTTAANESMAPVHDRMPLILPRGDIGRWILDGTATVGFLSSVPPLLNRSQEYEQQTLPLDGMFSFFDK